MDLALRIVVHRLAAAAVATFTRPTDPPPSFRFSEHDTSQSMTPNIIAIPAAIIAWDSMPNC